MSAYAAESRLISWYTGVRLTKSKMNVKHMIKACL